MSVDTWGPSVADTISAMEEVERLRNISEEMSVLVDQALLDILVQSMPPGSTPSG